MATIILNANSTTLVLNETAINDTASGDIIELAPLNPHTSHQNGSVGVNINRRVDGDSYNLIVRVQRKSDSDIFLNSAINGEEITVFNGSLKENFVKDGIAGVESWILESGSITTLPTETFNDTDGNAMMEYTLQFRSCRRNI